MIDEMVLERALRAEAETYALPEGGPDAIRAAAARSRATAPGRRRGRGWLVAAAAVAGLAVGAVAVRGPAGVPILDPASRDGLALNEGVPGAGGKGAGGGLTGGGAAAPDAAADPAVVRTGDVSVEVRDVPEAVGALTRLATARRGFVAQSRVEGEPDSPVGSVTVRVPAAEFDAAVAEAGRMGRVVSSSTGGVDVSGEVADVAARLRSLTAARTQLQTLLARAANVGEVLSVQQRLTETQTQIEQLQAKQKSLEDSTTYGTLRVALHEPGTLHEERTGFAKAWHDAVDGFVGAAQGLVAASGTVAFVLLVLGALALLLRPVYRAWVRRIV